MTNLTNTPCIIFSSISQNLLFHSFSLYCRSASYRPLWNRCPISYHMHQQSLQSLMPKYGLCTYVKWIGWHTIQNFNFFKMAAIRHLGFDPTRNSTIRSAVPPKNPTLELNMKGIGWPVAELWPFESFAKCVNGPWGRSSVVGRRSVVNIHTSYTDLIYSSFATNLAREE